MLGMRTIPKDLDEMANVLQWEKVQNAAEDHYLKLAKKVTKVTKDWIKFTLFKKAY